MKMYHHIFDSHAHYDDNQFDNDRHQLLSSMPENGVTHIVTCGCDVKSTEENKKLAEEYDFIFFASGIHPQNLECICAEQINDIKKLALHPKCVAIGEIGLDYYWMNAPKAVQKDFFRKQIELARELDLPVIVHDRNAHGDTLELLKETHPKGVIHCFSGSREMAADIIELGMYIGIGGVVTFKNARKILEIVKEIPLERLVLETDCPYLAPEPKRGTRNDSALIFHIAIKLGELLGLKPQKILDITNENAKRLFSI